MKLTSGLLLLLIVLQLQSGECRPKTWFPQNIVDVVSNKTTQLTTYVKEKGRSLKNFYINNVRNKITPYFIVNKTINEYNIDKQVKVRNKFNSYIRNAQENNNKVFDNIAPDDNNKCAGDDPTNRMATPQLIAMNGYPAESHTVVTDDGYILTIHRIPFSKKATSNSPPRKTVLLHHGLLGSSADWIIPGPNKGLGYILSDAGYDVWFANARGNTYSRAHVSRNIDTFAFWNFTFHEVSQHDLPAVIDYIVELKGRDTKINYIGHSMGTTVLFALLSTQTQYNKILRAGFALAPVAFMTDIKSPMRILARFADNIEYLLKLLGANEFLPQNAVLRWLTKHACEINHWEEAICENSLFVLCGHDEGQFNKTLLPLILGHSPAGASTKTLIHYAQEIKHKGLFKMFDYGSKGNIKEYGVATPPEYPLHKITLPIALFSAENDWLSSQIDVKNLYVQIANPIEHYVVPYKEFNHLDFLWAIDAPTLLYAKLLELLEDGAKYDSNLKVDTNTDFDEINVIGVL